MNDRCIGIGWAGYDARVRDLPPEHLLAHSFREVLTESLRPGGVLAAQGPDGKLLVRLRENHDHWALEHVLVTLQHLEDVALLDLAAAVDHVLAARYGALRAADPRWSACWGDVEVLVNPNGPLLNGGSDGDNGQTGRKLVADYYGPRIPLGGGALCGKGLTHIDRASAYAARQAAVNAVADGAGDCLVTLTFAPNGDEALEVSYEIRSRVATPQRREFAHERIRRAYAAVLPVARPRPRWALLREGGTVEPAGRRSGTTRRKSGSARRRGPVSLGTRPGTERHRWILRSSSSLPSRELRPIQVRFVQEHAVDGVEQFPHHGDECVHRLLSACE